MPRAARRTRDQDANVLAHERRGGRAQSERGDLVRGTRRQLRESVGRSAVYVARFSEFAVGLDHSPHLPAASATILAATLQLFRDDAIQPFGNTDGASIHVVPTNPASDFALTDGDFDRVTFASKGSFELASMINNAFNNVPITDLSVINRTGVTRIGAILSNDLNNVPPSGDNGFGGAAPNTPRLVNTFQVP